MFISDQYPSDMIAFDVLLGEATNIEKSVSGSLDVEYAISDSDIG